MRYFYDTEFYETPDKIHLISIGIVAEDGREFYAENQDFDWGIVPDEHWLWENVYPWLNHERTSKNMLANRVRLFITNDGKEYHNELWAYYAAYDHVVLAQLFGRMVDMPEGVPWYTLDLKQVMHMNWDYIEGNLDVDPVPLQDGVEHHALADAKWNKKVYDWLHDME